MEVLDIFLILKNNRARICQLISRMLPESTKYISESGFTTGMKFVYMSLTALVRCFYCQFKIYGCLFISMSSLLLLACRPQSHMI